MGKPESFCPRVSIFCVSFAKTKLGWNEAVTLVAFSLTSLEYPGGFEVFIFPVEGRNL